MKGTIRTAAVAAGLPVAAFILVAMVGEPAAAAENFKIGMLIPMSGTLAPVGKQERFGFELAAKEINESGGILGRHIEFVVEDTESNPQTAARKAEKLYQQDKVDFVTGTVHSGGTLAVGQVAARNGRLMSTTVSYSTRITGAACSPNVFRVNAHAGIQANALTAWLLNNVKGKRYLILAPDYEMGRNATSQFSNRIKAGGGEIVDEVYPPLGAKDFSTYFGRIRAARPDVLLTMTPGNDTVRLLTQMKDYGLLGGDMLIGGAAGAVTRGNIGAMKGAAEGFLTAASYSPLIDTAQNKAFVAKFQTAYNIKPDLFAVDSYSMIYLLKAAAEKAGGLEPGKLRKGMENLSWDTPQGRRTMRGADHQAVLDMYIIRVKGVQFDVIGKVNGDEVVGTDECERF